MGPPPSSPSGRSPPRGRGPASLPSSRSSAMRPGRRPPRPSSRRPQGVWRGSARAPRSLGAQQPGLSATPWRPGPGALSTTRSRASSSPRSRARVPVEGPAAGLSQPGRLPDPERPPARPGESVT